MSVLLIILCGVPLCMAETDVTWEARTNAPALRVGLIGDSHITPYDTKAVWFEAALNAFSQIGANKLDGLALSGDNVYFDNTTLSDGPYDVMYNHINKIIPSKQIVYTMGNHEFPQNDKSEAMSAAAIDFFEEKTGQTLNYHTIISGFHFITSGAKDYNGALLKENEEWLMQEIDNAIGADSKNSTYTEVGGVKSYSFENGIIPDSEKPVFIMLHHPIAKTVFNQTNTKYSEEFLTFLKERPQVINIVAHEHVAPHLPQNIWQDGFTVYHSPLCSNGNISVFNLTKDSEENYYDVAHFASMIEVENNIVKIFKLDLSSKKYIGEPWEIDIPSIVTSLTDDNTTNDKQYFNYSSDKSENTNTPYYPNSASVSAEVNGNSVNVIYSTNAKNEATGKLQDGFVRGYKLELSTASGKVYSSTFQHDFYMETPSKTQTRKITGLGYDVDYTATVYPMSPFGIYGEGISTTFTTEKEQLPDGAVRYEFEDYISSSFVINNISASERKLVGSKTTMQNPSFSFDINLENAGFYDISYALGHNTADWVSLINIKVDNKVIGNNDISTAYIKDISQNETYAWSYMPMRLYEKKAEYFSSGKHTVTFEVNLVKNDPTVYKFFADYIQFTPNTDIKTVKKGEKTRFEFEEYANKHIIENLSYASGNKIVAQINGNSKATVTGNFVVNKSGYYDLEYVVGHVPTSNLQWVSAVTITIDDKTVGVNDLNFKEDLRSTYTYWKNSAPMSKYVSEGIYLEEGKHHFDVNIAITSGDSQYKYQLDYMEFSSTDYPKSIRLEAENYANMNIRTSDTKGNPLTNAGNSKVVGHDYGTEKPTINGSFEILESGYYDFTYVAGHLPAGQTPYISTVTFYIDNAPVGINDLNFIENISAIHTDYWSTAPMSRYVTEKIWLESGPHTFNIDVSKTTYDSKYKYQVDYMELNPSDSFAVLSDNTFKSGTWLAKPYTGNAIIALYSGNKLVDISVTPVENTMCIKGDFKDISNVTEVKLFVWSSDILECYPLTDIRNLIKKSE